MESNKRGSVQTGGEQRDQDLTILPSTGILEKSKIELDPEEMGEQISSASVVLSKFFLKS